MSHQTEFIKTRAEALNRLSILTAHSSNELMDMYEKSLRTTPQEQYAPDATAIYRIGAMLDVIARRLEDESEWYEVFMPKQPNKAALTDQPEEPEATTRRDAFEELDRTLFEAAVNSQHPEVVSNFILEARGRLAELAKGA